MKTPSLVPFRPTIKTLVVALMLTTTPGLEAAIFSYYVGVDGLQNIATGEFAGQPNPNYNRLTFLYAHPNETTPSSNHYHSKGVYRYQPGSLASPVIEVSPSNYLPEGTAPPLAMTRGTGLYASKLVVLEDQGNIFSLIDIKDTTDLSGFATGSGEHFMFNSSSGRWTGSIAGAHTHLVLESLTPGLNIGSDSSLDIGLALPGDDYHLGDDVSFSPVFWLESNAPAGTYVARFKLVDEEGLFGDSGHFEFRMAAVPEPATGLLGLAGLAFLVSRRRR
jgi:hypothetical protein